MTPRSWRVLRRRGHDGLVHYAYNLQPWCRSAYAGYAYDTPLDLVTCLVCVADRARKAS